MKLVPGKEYRRTEIHSEVGGQRQGGISTPSGEPLVLLFTGESGHAYGYQDGFQADGTFWYTGEGQVGDMSFTRGNLAIRDSSENGKSLHLFEQVRKGFVRYMGEAEYLDHHLETGADLEGNPRSAIVFELGLTNLLPTGSAADLRQPRSSAPTGLKGKTLAELRAAALMVAPPTASKKERRTVVRIRSAAVRAYVLKRADGSCECCGEAAPFLRSGGEAYLEPHHILRLADGGPDHPRWVAATCPNCHREIHCGADGATINTNLGKTIGAKEGDG